MAVAPWVWFVTAGGIALAAAGEQLTHRRLRERPLHAAVLSSAGWVILAVGFGIGIGAVRGSSSGVQFFSGYLLELALSVDNVLVFALMFSSFRVPKALQHRVLSFGVLGAIVLRGGFIAAGGALVDNVSWIFYLFGSFLVVTGVRMARGTDHVAPDQNRVLRLLQRVVPVAPSFAGERFFVRDEGRLLVTPLFAALVAIETTDIVFATDSIPAIFGVTRDLFLVATSNALAVLGLRSLYFVLAEAITRFRYLGRALALLLVLIGIKMLLASVVHVPIWMNLGGIVLVLSAGIVLSLVAEARHGPPASSHRGGGGGNDVESVDD